MILYLYANHLGGFFFSEYDDDEYYCEQCGDSDYLVGTILKKSDIAPVLMKELWYTEDKESVIQEMETIYDDTVLDIIRGK